MQRAILFLVIGLFWCNTSFAANYEKLLTKAKTANNKETMEIMDEAILGLEFENGFLEDCLSEIKYLKEWGDNCKKAELRKEGQLNIIAVFSVVNFKNNLSEIAKKIDKGEKLAFINKAELQNKIDSVKKVMGERYSLFKKINFLRDNL